MDTELNGFAANEGGVSDDTSTNSGISATESQDAPSGGGQETTAQTPSGGTPKEARLIPEEDLNKLRSTYDRRISDIQRQNEQYQQSLQNMEMALLESRWQGLAPEDAASEKSEYARIVNERASAAARTQLAQQEAQLNELAKPLFAQHLSTQYGVPVDTLLKFGDAETMQTVAQTLSVQQNAVKLQERKASGVDRMEGAGSASGGPAWGEKRGEDLLSWYYRQNRKRT
ncbi:MAG: hypothetical protein HYX52_05710 [Chloroflexi bacterium]|nr:hypothetical protein [Chloroflexota bacterium]